MGIYIVKWGDTVCSIAKKYGVLSQSIIEANGLRSFDQLVINQTLFIPLGERDRRKIQNN